ncbi:hypothetical protein IJG01_01685 [Candidatus Saccharibacteria bacterium]|nr:hypothetical protein [Candidatus Saccharibacteria bacterium]
MNKDVIYIEPEDDITDIITKIENAKAKIVALVPPKKAGVFRSVVNIKLISKAGASADKKVVLVTADPSIMKLAAATKLPVAKNLQTAPIVPTDDLELDDSESDEVVEETPEKTEEPEDETEKDEEAPEDTKEVDSQEAEPAVKPEKAKKAKSGTTAKTGNKIIGWIKEHKKITIGGGIGALLLILALIWAFAIAPSVTITVGIRTNSYPFSENVTFTTNLTDEKAGEGKFYLDQKKIESVQEVEFEATGKKNLGEKASGELIVYAYFPLNIKSSVQISEGEIFTISGLSFKATKGVVLTYSGEGRSECANKDNSEGLVDYGCRINGTVPVIASESGNKYNIAASSTGWDTNARVFAYSDKAMSGGTDKEITVVQQSDIDKAKGELSSANESENKAKLYEGLGDDALVIDSSFKQETADAVSTPAVGEEVKEGEKAKLKAVTTTSVYVIDKTKVEEFIAEKAKIEAGHKIYEMQNPFVENFLKTDAGYTGRLKTNYMTGPTVTVASIVDLVKGHGTGDATHLLKDINGVNDVKIDTSFPWVTSIPSDTNKITVNLEIKDQDGNKVEQTFNRSEDGDKEEGSAEENTSEDTKKE